MDECMCYCSTKMFFLIFILEYRKNYSGPKNTNEAREA